MRLLSWMGLFGAVIVGAFIFYISSMQFPPNPFPTFSLTSTLYHFGIFLVFGFFLFLTIAEKRIFSGWFLLVAILVVIYAGLDELHQYFVPGRACTLVDFGTDMLGELFGGLGSRFGINQYRKGRQSHI